MLPAILLISATVIRTAAADFSEGMNAFEKKDYTAARRCLTRIIEAKDAVYLQDDALYWRGRAAELSGDAESSREDYYRILCDFKSEYAEDAMNGFKRTGGSRDDLVDRSTPGRMWQSFCRAVFERDSESAMSCLGNELKKDVRMVLKEDPGAFWTDLFSDLARMRAVKVEEQGEERAVLVIGLAGKDDRAGIFSLALVKNDTGWVIHDAVEAPVSDLPQEASAAERMRKEADPAAYDWPETLLDNRRSAKLKALLKELGSDSFLEREKAVREIVSMGKDVGGTVAGYLNDDDPEVRFRVKEILEQIIENDRKRQSGR